MGVIKNRNLARRKFKSLVSRRSEVLSIHYSQKDLDGIEQISPMITSIAVRSLDNSINEIFAIHLEADLLDDTTYDIADLYPELELSMLKKFNEFARKHQQYSWVHWDMSTQDFGFQAIRHRYIKLAGEKSGRDYKDIPMNKKIDLHLILRDMYGDKFVVGDDTLFELITINNNNITDNNYLTRSQESHEFDNRNYHSITSSLRSKTNSICYFVTKLIDRKLKVANKNSYAIFLDFISHPLFNLVAWVIGILGFVIGLLQAT